MRDDRLRVRSSFLLIFCGERDLAIATAACGSTLFYVLWASYLCLVSGGKVRKARYD